MYEAYSAAATSNERIEAGIFKALNASRMGNIGIGSVVEEWEKGNLVEEIRYEVVASQGSTGSSSMR